MDPAICYYQINTSLYRCLALFYLFDNFRTLDS